jgi:hypothetical protein
MRTEEAERATARLNQLVGTLKQLHDITGLEMHEHQIAGVYLAAIALDIRLYEHNVPAQYLSNFKQQFGSVD